MLYEMTYLCSPVACYLQSSAACKDLLGYTHTQNIHASLRSFATVVRECMYMHVVWQGKEMQNLGSAKSLFKSKLFFAEFTKRTEYVIEYSLFRIRLSNTRKR